MNTSHIVFLADEAVIAVDNGEVEDYCIPPSGQAELPRQPEINQLKM